MPITIATSFHKFCEKVVSQDDIMVFACKGHVYPLESVLGVFQHHFIGFLCPYNAFQDDFDHKNTDFSLKESHSAG